MSELNYDSLHPSQRAHPAWIPPPHMCENFTYWEVVNHRSLKNVKQVRQGPFFHLFSKNQLASAAAVYGLTARSGHKPHLWLLRRYSRRQLAEGCQGCVWAPGWQRYPCRVPELVHESQQMGNFDVSSEHLIEATDPQCMRTKQATCISTSQVDVLMLYSQHKC